MENTKHGIRISCMKGDIAAQPDIDAVVNAANAELMPGGGVAGAIHRAAGPELVEACVPKAPIQPGESVITQGFGLPNDYVIHTLGPVYGADKPEEELLEQCYVTALRIAEENGISRIAFPAISTGAFGYPLQEAIEVAIPTVITMTENLKTIREIRFVLYSEADLQAYEAFLSSV